MAIVSYTPSLAEKYILPLINLSDNIKLEIISKLSASMLNKANTDENADWVETFYGCWKDDRRTEDIVEDIRNSRVSNRETEQMLNRFAGCWHGDETADEIIYRINESKSIREPLSL